MNAATLNSSAVQPGRVAFFIRLAGTPLFHTVAPSENWMGTHLLRRLLVNALRARLPEPPSVCLCFDLNRCVGFVPASDRDAALQVLIAELRAVALLPATQILWLDDREAVWRTHPAGCAGADMLPDQMKFEEWADASAALHPKFTQ